MDFARIRLAIDHYESIAGRLTFEVAPISVPDGKGKPVERFAVRPVGNGTPVSYPTYEGRVEADAVCAEYNQRSRAFLTEEHEIVRDVLRHESDA